MSTSGQHFSPNWRMNSVSSIDPSTQESLRRWHTGLTEPLPAVRVFDLGYGQIESLTTVSLDDAAILLAAPVDYDLLERLVAVRKALHAQQRWMVALGKNCIGAETELMHVDLSYDDAKAAADALDLEWRAANPEAGFGTRRHATITPHAVKAFVRVRASTIEGYTGTSGAAAKYLARLSELASEPIAHELAIEGTPKQSQTPAHCG